MAFAVIVRIALVEAAARARLRHNLRSWGQVGVPFESAENLGAVVYLEKIRTQFHFGDIAGGYDDGFGYRAAAAAPEDHFEMAQGPVRVHEISNRLGIVPIAWRGEVEEDVEVDVAGGLEFTGGPQQPVAQDARPTPSGGLLKRYEDDAVDPKDSAQIPAPLGDKLAGLTPVEFLPEGIDIAVDYRRGALLALIVDDPTSSHGPLGDVLSKRDDLDLCKGRVLALDVGYDADVLGGRKGRGGIGVLGGLAKAQHPFGSLAKGHWIRQEGLFVALGRAADEVEEEDVISNTLELAVGAKDPECPQGAHPFLVGEVQADFLDGYHPAQVDLEPPSVERVVLAGLPIGGGVVVDDQVGIGRVGPGLPHPARLNAGFRTSRGGF